MVRAISFYWFTRVEISVLQLNVYTLDNKCHIFRPELRISIQFHGRRLMALSVPRRWLRQAQ